MRGRKLRRRAQSAAPQRGADWFKGLYLEDLRAQCERTGRDGEPIIRALRRLPAADLTVPSERVMLWSDPHFGHENVIRYTGRPFDSAVEMNAVMESRLRQAMAPDSLLLCLGDLAMGPALHEGTWGMIRGLPCRTALVVGNHDLTGSGDIRVDGFDEMLSCAFLPGSPNLVFTHFPLDHVPEGCLNVHGHTHERLSDSLHHVNVSVEHTDYRPLALSRVQSLVKAFADGVHPPGGTTLAMVEAAEVDGQPVSSG